MYERFFGFTERPFELTANPRYLFLTERYREALGTLTYGLSSRKGILVMTGEAGTGKTTMLTVAHGRGAAEPARGVPAAIPTLTRGEFIEFMTAQLGLPEAVAVSKTRFLRAVTELLEERASAGQPHRARHRRGAQPAERTARGGSPPRQHRTPGSEAADRGARGTARTRRPAQRPVAPAAEAAGRAALRAGAADAPGIGGVHRQAHQPRGRRQRAGLHARGRARGVRVLGRHSPPHQRDLRQRPRLGLCAGRAARVAAGRRGGRARLRSAAPRRGRRRDDSAEPRRLMGSRPYSSRALARPEARARATLATPATARQAPPRPRRPAADADAVRRARVERPALDPRP